MTPTRFAALSYFLMRSFCRTLLTNKLANDCDVGFVMQDFREHNTDTKVHFELTLSEENMAIALAEGLVKKFKLTTTISTSNMHLFDAKGIIKKYDTPEQGMTQSLSLFFPIMSTVTIPVAIDMGIDLCLSNLSHGGFSASISVTLKQLYQSDP